MAERLPTSVVLQAVNRDGYVYYVDGDKDGGRVHVSGRSAFNPFSKIEIEPSKLNRHLIHLRFRHASKYWSATDGKSVYASSNTAEESESRSTCTLFEPRVEGAKLYLHHAHTRKPLIHTSSGVDIDTSNDGGSLTVAHAFTWSNADEIVELPKFVAFKGYNDKYLRSKLYFSSIFEAVTPYLMFLSEDPNQIRTAHEVQLLNNGYLRIKSLHFGKYWCVDPTWVVADSVDESNVKSWFQAVNINGGKIVLKSVGSGLFCRSLSVDGKTDTLNANIATMMRETFLEVKSLVTESKVYNVRFREDLSRVSDETPYLMGVTTADNVNGQGEMMVAVRLAKEVKTLDTVSNSVSVTAGITTSFNLGAEAVKVGTIEFSASITGEHSWGKANEDTTTIEAVATIPVPKKSRAILECIGTKGKCIVPFSYTQEDKSSYDASIVRNERIDGIFTSVQYYGFTFKIRNIQTL